MYSQKVVQQSMRRLALQHPSFTRSSISRLAAPGAIATGRHVQRRPITSAPTGIADTKPETPEGDAGSAILIAQRRNRPISPHLSIYKPQVTWTLSIANRITGSMISGVFYIFGAAYLVAPLFGWHMESASIAAAFGAWPLLAKVAVKSSLAFPFTFHSFNGIRHLMWDMGMGYKNFEVVRTGWAVLGLSAVAAVGLVLM